MKNPLRKRLPRELKGELGKYQYQYMLQIPASAVSGNKFDGLISLLEFQRIKKVSMDEALKNVE